MKALISSKPMLSTALLAASGLFSQVGLAHTRLQDAVVMESSRRHGTYDTAAVIPHGCDGKPVIGSVLVMPDQTDSVVQTSTDGFQTYTTSNKTAADFIARGGFVRLVMSNDAFPFEDLIRDPQGNPIGFWAGGGKGLPPHDWVAKVPFRITAVSIKPESCAKSVTLVPAIVNVCKISSIAQFHEPGVVDLWTAPDAGSPFDAPDWTYPATFKVERDLENNPLPAGCGDGEEVRIFPSAAQLDRDMKVVIDGQQIWPLAAPSHDHAH